MMKKVDIGSLNIVRFSDKVAKYLFFKKQVSLGFWKGAMIPKKDMERNISPTYHLLSVYKWDENPPVIVQSLADLSMQVFRLLVLMITHVMQASLSLAPDISHF